MAIPRKKLPKRGNSRGNTKSASTGRQRLTYALAWLSVALCWCFGLPSLIMASLALWRMKGNKQKGTASELGRFAAITGMITGFCFTLYYVASLVSGAYIHFN